MFEKAIVAYIDVLGYQKLVEKVIGNEELIKRLDSLFYSSAVDSVKKLSGIDLTKSSEGTDKEDWEYFQKIVNNIKVKCIADSFIYTLPISEINFSSKSFNQEVTVLNCIETFFSVITMSATLFISKTGSPLRGGISIGRHYESERENQLFIFSEAHNKAVLLESNAINPRILLDAPALTYLNEVKYPHIDKFFYKDANDGHYCLDLYSTMQIWGSLVEKVLSSITAGISLNLQENWNNKKELGKLISFAKYHNSRVKDSSNLTINLDKYNQRHSFLKKQKPKRKK